MVEKMLGVHTVHVKHGGKERGRNCKFFHAALEYIVHSYTMAMAVGM